ncbi:helix-turn-helix transcriptional regulator [Streptomyces scopuliridis]|uniref:helix-turn-helix transcriptional regulator n=1 Tax=Streptomyces scopuliridis TaxID=452529 RepID=UPI003690F1FB
MAREPERDRETPRRRALLDALRDVGTPLGVTEIAERVGIHPNTARFHLDALVTQGAVEREREESSGPGRPRTVYAPRRGMDRGGKRGYQLLARILLSQLASTGPDAEPAAMETGRLWGRHLIEPAPPFHQVSHGEAVERVSGLLAELGFDPAVDGGSGDGAGAGETPHRIRLRHCPFLELAEEFQEILCPLHLGMLQGALAELRAPVAATRLEPFARPEVCLAHLTSVPLT